MNSQRGLSLVEVMIAIAISSALSLMSGYMIYMSQTQYNEVVADFWLDMRRNELQNMLRSDRIWNTIVADNPQMICTTQPQGCPAWGNPARADENIRIRMNGQFLDGNNPGTGMTRAGDFCTTFNPVNNDGNCIYGISLRWRALCSNSACANPEPRVKIEFRRGSKGEAATRLERSNFSFLRNQKLNTLAEICTTLTGDPSAYGAPTPGNPSGTCTMTSLNGSCDTASGFYLTGFDPTGAPTCSTLNIACNNADEVLYGFDSAGLPQCVRGCNY